MSLTGHDMNHPAGASRDGHVPEQPKIDPQGLRLLEGAPMLATRNLCHSLRPTCVAPVPARLPADFPCAFAQESLMPWMAMATAASPQPSFVRCC